VLSVSEPAGSVNEGGGKLGVPIVEQEADWVVTLLQLHDEVAGLLGHPRTVRVACAAAQVHTARLDLDEEQDVDPPQRHRLDSERSCTRSSSLLVISSFLRGLSTRDVEAALEKVFEEPIASKSTVSRVCEDSGRDTASGVSGLDQHDIVYCFLDAINSEAAPRRISPPKASWSARA